MIYVSLKGRMCNQMFQIAAAKALSIDNNVDFVCSSDASGITPTFSETSKYRSTIFKKIKFTNFRKDDKIFHNGSSDFSYKKIKYQNNLCLNGYYQSEKYFNHQKSEVYKLFQCPEKIESFINKKFQKTLSIPNSCSVHIRRGDYLKFKDYHNNLTLKYYFNCMEHLSDCHFVFFSDDIEWCRNQFENSNSSFINTGSDIIDFYLMSKMKKNIIANSSFSWWAAWLNNNDNKRVLAPSKWFGPKNNSFNTKDLIPESWEIIDA